MKNNNHNHYNDKSGNTKMSNSTKSSSSLDTIVRRTHRDTREEVRSYFNGRGINNDSIDKNMLGAGNFDGHYKYMIPVFDREGKVAYIKLRRAQADEGVEAVADVMSQPNPIPKYVIYPEDAKPILVGEDQLAKSSSSDVLICRGELDRIIAEQEGVEMPVVTGGGLVQSFKKEWMGQLKNMRNIYVCLGNDSVGKLGAEKLIKSLTEHIPTASIYKIELPFDDNPCADLTDYFVEKRGTADELFAKYAKYCGGAKPIDPTQFKELTVDDIASILDSTIKYDYVSKTITFLAMLLAYTDSDQLNVMFNASSSTGKSFICHEVGEYFPQQDVDIYGKTTPNAFYYSQRLRKKDKGTGEPYIDLERRIMIFVEQPDSQLQANLRAVLSHEKKKVPFAITNKTKSGKNTAEEGYIMGYPSAFFCSANATIDEQEQTRSIILSPDSSRKKVLAGIDAYIDKNCHRDAFENKLQSNEDRMLLKERIQYIKSLNVGTIDVGDSEYLKQRFIDSLGGNMSPGAMRGIQKFTSLAKAIALINAPFRSIKGKITMSNKDVDEAMKLWEPICESMIHSLSPQIFNFYKDVVVPAWQNKRQQNPQANGITFKEIRVEYYKQMGSFPHMENMRKQWIPTLELAEFIRCERNHGGDGREKLIIPLVSLGEGLEK